MIILGKSHVYDVWHEKISVTFDFGTLVATHKLGGGAISFITERILRSNSETLLDCLEKHCGYMPLLIIHHIFRLWTNFPYAGDCRLDMQAKRLYNYCHTRVGAGCLLSYTVCIFLAFETFWKGASARLWSKSWVRLVSLRDVICGV